MDEQGGISRFKWLAVLVVALVVIIIYFGWLKLMEPSVLPIKVVKVTGEYPKTNRQSLKQLLLPLVNNGFFGVNVSTVKQKLLSLPWVATASVSRRWPDTLIVAVRQQQAFARWNNTKLMNASGDIFNSEKVTYNKTLPSLVGPDGQNSLVLEHYNRMKKIVNKVGLSIAKLTLSQRRSWRLVLNNGVILVLGRVSPLQRLTKFVKMYQKVFAAHAKEILYIDLRYPNGMAVRWLDDKHRFKFVS